METIEATEILTGILLSRVTESADGSAVVTEALTLTREEVQALVVGLQAFLARRSA